MCPCIINDQSELQKEGAFWAPSLILRKTVMFFLVI